MQTATDLHFKNFSNVINDFLEEQSLLKSQNIILTNQIAVLEKQDKFSIDMRNKLHKENHTLHSILFNGTHLMRQNPFRR